MRLEKGSLLSAMSREKKKSLNFSIIFALLLLEIMMMASCARSSLRRMLPRVTSSLMPTFSGHIAVTPINTHRFYHSSVSHLFSSVDKEAAENTVVGRCSSLLKQLSPVSCRVRASNDDPNGSHVSFHWIAMMISCFDVWLMNDCRSIRRYLLKLFPPTLKGKAPSNDSDWYTKRYG